MRPSPTSLYGLIIQAPLMSHFIASYTRAGVFCCLKADLSSSPHIPVEGESLITLDPEPKAFQADVPGPVCNYHRSKPTAWHPHIPHTSACLPAGHQQLAKTQRSFNLSNPEGEPCITDK
ncbi:hypothetical protein BgiBS90_007766 [Biomphalaria glabrata]|nr:hypothetical protein BgiBS90_007766 [Biomphalaria glabrata]